MSSGANMDGEFIASLRRRLDTHPIYGAVKTLADLRVFMQHHIYSVWDFMSLIKYLQHAVAPARWPWVPGSDPSIQRFINELVLEEETDEAGPGKAPHHPEECRRAGVGHLGERALRHRQGAIDRVAEEPDEPIGCLEQIDGVDRSVSALDAQIDELSRPLAEEVALLAGMLRHDPAPELEGNA